MPPSERIRVLLVDDHRLVRAGVRGLLQVVGDIEVVGEAASGEEACRIAPDLNPTVMVIDVSLPGISGLETITRLRRILPEARILVLTMHEAAPFPRLALEGGASGYLSKRSAPEELVTAVREIAAGRTYLGRTVAETAITGGADPDPATALHGLGARELEILTLLARGRTVNEIAAALHLSPKTVHSHRARLLRRLKVHSTAELAQIAARAGVFNPYGDCGT